MKRLAVLLILLVLAGCDESMDHQNRFRTYGSAAGMPGWPSEGEALPLVTGTVAQSDRERLQEISEPPPVSLALLQEGRQRYDIYCAACHGLTGAGNGIIVARGFPRPLPFDDPSLMQASARDLVEVIGQGYRRMYAFADRVEPHDRWAIAAYIRALQLAHSGKPRSP